MIVECKNCGTRLKVDEDRIGPQGSKVRCSNCSRIFTVRKPSGETGKKPSAVSAPRSKKEGAEIVALSNQKGGVAKTTSCLNIGVSLSLLKKRVLLVDFDVQASLSSCLGFQDAPSFYDAIGAGDKSIAPAIKKTRYQNLWVLPSNRNMVMLNKNYFGAKNFEFVLKEKLKPVRRNFDYILIDTPPSMEFYTMNALTASDWVIVPSNCEFLSTQGVHQTVAFLSAISGRSNPQIDYKVLITMYDGRDTVSKLIYTKLKKMHGEKTFETVIGVDTKVRESQVMRTPIIYYYKHSPSALQYVTLAREIIGK
jgi:chromosome partitioning protein